MIQLDVLTEAEVEAIHFATLRILAEVGIVLSQVDALEILAGAGASVKDGRVYLPGTLVEREVARCPPR